MHAPAAAIRSDGTAPLPPERLAPVRGRRPLKAWRYVGLYGPDVMLCAGRVRIGGLPQAFWAVWDREAGVLHDRTTFVPGAVALPGPTVGGRPSVRRPRTGPATPLRIRGRGVAVDLALEPFGEQVDVTTPHGGNWTWTRKTLVRARGTVHAGGRTRAVDGPALIDDSAGYHARATDWEWSAGVGTLTDGRPVAWNLVDGVHDAASDSERSVWVDGVPHEVGPVAFTPTLDGVRFAEGDAITFCAESVRERHDALGPIRSDYVQPFGTFAGALPGAGTLAAAFGVMERHHARW